MVLLPHKIDLGIRTGSDRYHDSILRLIKRAFATASNPIEQQIATLGLVSFISVENSER
jgi:hypothetical protein